MSILMVPSSQRLGYDQSRYHTSKSPRPLAAPFEQQSQHPQNQENDALKKDPMLSSRFVYEKALAVVNEL